MKVLVTRIKKGKVSVAGKTVDEVGRGLAVFAGIEKTDTDQVLAKMADKVANLRIFADDQGRFHYSVSDLGLQILCISNFTLCADTEKGRRPSFDKAMSQDKADVLFEKFVSLLCSKKIDARNGVFGADMDIDLEMDGPVNIVLSV